MILETKRTKLECRFLQRSGDPKNVRQNKGNKKDSYELKKRKEKEKEEGKKEARTLSKERTSKAGRMVMEEVSSAPLRKDGKAFLW